MKNPKWIIRAKGKILLEQTQTGLVLPELNEDAIATLPFPLTLIKSHPVNAAIKIDTDKDTQRPQTKAEKEQEQEKEYWNFIVAVASTDEDKVVSPYIWVEQRDAFAKILSSFGLNHHYTEALLKGLGVIEWMENHQYCGRCGALNVLDLDELAFHCEKCEVYYYPKMSPSILVRITRGDEILLARSSHFKEGLYSNVAGFIELGENAEECIHREVFEEVGLKVHNIRYFGSQYWPFPNSFMLAYTAEYLSGDIVICPKEIEDARWFSKDNLPPHLPSTFSISGGLVEDFLNH